jgi:NDP-sugar pyrophosphorylase family protein
MKAMIFAAGLGTRLRPHTNDRPKALVEVGGKTLLQHVIERLKNAGVTELIINVHHFADKVEKYLERKENFGLKIHVSDERDLLLETGGGLKKARKYLDGDAPFIVHNTDILTDFDLKEMYQESLENQAIATLAVRNRETSRYLLFSKKTKKLTGWKNIKTGEIKKSRRAKNPTSLAFSGVSILHPRIFDFMLDEDAFSIIPVLLKAAKTENIFSYQHDDSFWLDVGKLPALPEAEAFLKKRREVSGKR